MTLHPQAESILELFKVKNSLALENLKDVTAARELYIKSSKLLNVVEDIHMVEDLEIVGYKKEITIRIYSPNNKTSLPALVYFHGGGWVIGSIDTHDALCRSFANEAECKVISVDYSLAPEHKFPVPVEDAYLATKWVSDHASELGVDATRIAVGGDSAGANLAAVTCYLSNQRNSPKISHQLLFYPSTTFEPTDSYHKFGEGYYLTKESIKWFSEQYFSLLTENKTPIAAPMLIPDEEAALLPPAYIVTAEYDPLCDGGAKYASKLTNAGVDTTYICYNGMIHGFMTMTAFLETGKTAIKESARYLKNQHQN